MPDQETTEPCACWWSGGSLHGGHCCFLGPEADKAFAGLAPFCHEMPAAVESALAEKGQPRHG